MIVYNIHMDDIKNIKEFVVLVVGLFTVMTGIVNFFATKAVLQWRLERLEKTINGNGSPGMIEQYQDIKERISNIEVICKEHHKL